MKNPFNRIHLITNDPEGFNMPYALHGKVDLEVMAEKYNSLTNKPKSHLQVRFYNGKTTFS